jgi:hypothetical protein
MLAFTFLFILLFLLLLVYFVTQPTFVTNSGHWHNIVDQALLLAHVKALSSSLPSRSDKVDNLDVSADYIYQQFMTYSPKTSYQTFKVWGVEYKNVVTEFGPDEGALYVIGAHYDSYDGLPGADDNASGVSGLIELARLLSATNTNKRVQLVAYALEEMPYFRTEDMGSYHHAKNLSDKKELVAFMVSLEMIGYFDESMDQTYPLAIMGQLYPKKANFISVVGRFRDFSLTKYFKEQMRKAAPIGVYSLNAPPIIPGVDFSDHLNYWYFGYPAVMITDTAFYRNANYHTVSDTWDTLDYEKMAMVVQGVYYALLDYPVAH